MFIRQGSPGPHQMWVAEIAPHFHLLLHKILLLLSKILIFLSLLMAIRLRVGVARTSSNILDAVGMNLQLE